MRPPAERPDVLLSTGAAVPPNAAGLVVLVASLALVAAWLWSFYR